MSPRQPRASKTSYPDSDAAGAVYRLRLTVRDITPPIWRTVDVSADDTLLDLHRVIQSLFGWQDYHLWLFEVGRKTLGLRKLLAEAFGAGEVGDARTATLAAVLGGRVKSLQYNYDFGDDWWVDIRVEERRVAALPVESPRLMDGARAGPPDDVGGPYGYSEFLVALSDPRHSEHREIVGWIGEGWDPERFDKARLATALARRARRRR